MIIKSLGRRKQTGRSVKASVTALYSYITNGADENVPHIFHNLNMRNPADTFLDNDFVISQFENLINKLPHHKGRNLFYHEIISFKRNEFLPLEEQLDILRKTVILYLQERSPDNLAFASVHSDHADKHIHYHIMMSANTYIEPKRRFALSREEFSHIQKKMELTVQSIFPQLQLETVYNKEKTKEKDYYKTGKTEYGVKQRIGEDKKTYRQEVKDLLLQGFDLSHESQTFIEFIQKFQIRFYTRGKHVGIIFNGKRYRLNRLGLEERHELFYQKVIKFEQNMKSIHTGFTQDIQTINQKEIDSIEQSDLSTKEKENLKNIMEFLKENTNYSKDDFELN